MDRASKERKRNQDLKGMQFRLNLLIVFLSNAIPDVNAWGTFSEDQEWEKNYDLTDRSVFLKSKYKQQSKKITRDELFSCKSKTADFSLAKLFFSYLEIKSEFKEKSVIMCTNSEVNLESLDDILIHHNAERGHLLHCEDAICSFFTLNENVLPDLKTSVEIYFDKHLQGKGMDKAVITDEDLKGFLKNFQFFYNYPRGDKLHEIVERLLYHRDDMWCKMTHQEIYRKIGKRLKLAKGEHLTELRVKAMLSEMRSDKYCESLKDFNVSFDSNDLNVAKSERIIHVKVRDGNLLQMLKIYRALQGDKSRKLFVNPGNRNQFLNHIVEGHKQAVEAFHLHCYTFLIMDWTVICYETAKREIISKLRDILRKDEHKKIIFITDYGIDLAQEFGVENICQIDGFAKFQDLSKNTRRRLLKAKNVLFQGYRVSLGELLSPQSAEDFTKSLGAAMLEQLVREEIKVGVRPLDVDKDIAQFYISRRFEAGVHDERRNIDVLTEENLYTIKEKVIVITESVGTSQSIVLGKMAASIKKSNNHLWVIKINLNDYTKVFKEFIEKSRDEISAEELLNALEVTKMTDEIGKLVFSVKNKVVLMIDGVDDISPDYKYLVLSLLRHCQEAPNFLKVFVSTRSNKDLKLKEVGPFEMQPFTRLEQRDFLTEYWMHSMNLSHEYKDRCKQYAETLLDKVFSWSASDQYCQHSFFGVPLQVRLLAEIFQENIKGQKITDWEGCREYLEKGNMEPKLPEGFNIAKLYDTFIKNKYDVFIDKASTSGSVMTTPALLNQFESCFSYHRNLAIGTILPEYRQLFKTCITKDNDREEYILQLGIVQRLGDSVNFKHRTLAEYFLADSIVRELKLHNSNAHFQRLLIDIILRNDAFKNVRAFLNFLLQEVSLPPNNFKEYRSLKFKEANSNLIFQLALEGHVAILRLILLETAQVPEGYYVNPHKRNTINDLAVLVRKEGVHIKREDGEAPLHLAVRGGHLEMVDFLIKQGVNLKNEKRDSALHVATHQNNWSIFKYLVEHDAKVKAIDYNYCTALHHAVRHWDLSIVKYLVEHGADVNCGDNRGHTALHTAADLDKMDIVKYLVEYGANVNKEAAGYYTALHVASYRNNWNVVKYLVDHGADLSIHANYDEGHTALHFAAMFDQIYNAPNSDDDTGMYRKNRNIIKYLVEHGADVNDLSFQECAAIHFAAKAGKIDVVEYFLEHGADINGKDWQGDTPLTTAASEENWNMVKYLVEHGADINTGENDHCPALQLAVLWDIMDMVVYFVENGANINAKDCQSHTPLYLATYRMDWNIVKYLVEHGADANIADYKGRSALHYAVKYDKMDVVQQFLEHGADINLRDKKNRTVLHVATSRKNCKMVQYLLDKGADVNARDGEGQTALHCARRENLEIVDCLVLSGTEDVN